MQNWKTIVGVVGVFVLGMIAGGLVTARVLQKRVPRPWPPGSPVVVDWVVRRLDWQLGLDREQRQQILAIMQETQRALQKTQAQIRPQMDKIFAESNQKVRAVLRPDQQEKYDRIVAERRARWRGPLGEPCFGGRLRRGNPAEE